MLGATLEQTGPSKFSIAGEVSEKDGIVEGWFTFETELARGKGYARLRDDRCWTLLTSMEELKGFEEKKGRRRVFGAEHGIHRDRKSWLESKQDDERTLGTEHQPFVVVIGAGQGGLALGARLKRLGVPTILLEKNERPGDSWRKRYKSLCLHDPVWYDHMPYLPFPDDWPVYSPKDKIADWLEMYAKVMELNVWTSTSATSASYDEAKGEWTVNLDRNGEAVTLRPKHLVFATGMSGIPNEPTFPGMDRFKGEQHHSSRHSSSESYRGKRAVVIGSNNSAHDICADLWENGADVTMVQRTSTHVSTSDSLFRFGTSTLYSEAALERGMTTDKADLINASVPYGLMHQFHMPVAKAIREHDADLYDRLEKAGFMLDFGDDDSGLHMKYMRRGSGYYIDVGASELIANGDIKLRSGVDVEGDHRDRRQAQRWHGPAGRPDRLRDGLWIDERLGGATRVARHGREGRQGLGPRVRHHEGSGSVGRRAAQHVEAHSAGRPLVPGRQSPPVTALFAVFGVAAQGEAGRGADAGLRFGQIPP